MNEKKGSKMNKTYRVFYTEKGIRKVSGNFNSNEVATAYAINIMKKGISQHTQVMIEV
jgi:hypothetical protein